MSMTIISTANTTGVRRLRTLGEWALLDGWALGSAPDPDTLAQLQAAGYDMATIQSAISLGATDEQLLALPFPASPSEIADATQQLMSQLSGLQAAPGQPATSARNFPTIISNGFGVADLATQAGWDQAASWINTAKQAVQQAAALNPQDPTVVSNVSQLNSAIAKFAEYYASIVGQPTSVSPITLSGLHYGLGDVSVGQALWNILGPAGGLLNAIYQIYLWAKNYIATNQAIRQATANANLLAAQNTATTQYNALVAAGQGNSPAALALLASIKNSTATGPAPPPPSQPQNWAVWFQQNSGLIIGGLIAAVVVKSVLGRR